MLAKLSFLILVMAFGAAMFGAGVQAPPEVSEPVGRMLGQAALSLKERYESAERWASKASARAPGSLAVARYSDLLLTSPRAEQGAYGVQLGWYAELAAAEQQAQRARDVGQPVQLVAIGEDPASRSFLVAAGPFASSSEARAAERELRARPLAGQPVFAIRLPAPAPVMRAPAAPAPIVPAAPAPAGSGQ
jgi:hypothetical protein